MESRLFGAFDVGFQVVEEKAAGRRFAAVVEHFSVERFMRFARVQLLGEVELVEIIVDRQPLVAEHRFARVIEVRRVGVAHHIDAVMAAQLPQQLQFGQRHGADNQIPCAEHLGVGCGEVHEPAQRSEKFAGGYQPLFEPEELLVECPAAEQRLLRSVGAQSLESLDAAVEVQREQHAAEIEKQSVYIGSHII